jgi:prepilin-type N-terminal cleavage/methylation domain-containing protein
VREQVEEEVVSFGPLVPWMRRESVAGSQKLRKCGFTLVELLVVIAIIGVLVALLLPAIQAAREAARRTQCTSNLKNLALGMINHESSTGAWPSSGWKGNWTGDPDRGTGAKQPGSWLFSTLPYIEGQNLYTLGGNATGAARIAALQQRDATPLALANCPSRRSGGPYPYPHNEDAQTGNGQSGVFTYKFTAAARGDYAANVGDETGFDSKCISLSPSDYNTTKAGFPPSLDEFSGVSFCGTAVPNRAITDGLSHTIAIGEKWVPTVDYETGLNKGDDWALFVGFQDDTVRSTYYNNVSPDHVPQPDDANSALTNVAWRELFGSAHSAGCLFALCDGSVSLVAYDIEAETFRQMGHRADDGQPKPNRRAP